MVPAALGFIVSLPASAALIWLRAAMESLELEMKKASIDLVNYLSKREIELKSADSKPAALLDR
jgi:hypothetical protein